MARQKEPQDRQSLNLGLLDELIAPDHYIRLLAAFVERAVKGNEGHYTHKGHSPTGQKPYGAITLLLLYIYGYLNRISSSRRLEAEATRNIELIWLLGGLQPDFKTIADYRKDQGPHIRQLLKQFNEFLKDHAYIQGEQISVDGLRTKANTSRDALSVKKIENRLKKLDGKLKGYLQELEENDQREEMYEELGRLDIRKQAAIDQIARLEEEIQELLKKKGIIAEDPRKQVHFTDREASLTRGRDGCMPYYNNQSVVCDKNKFIMVWQVTNTANDRNNLKPMVERVAEEYGHKPALCRADSDYFNSTAIQELEQGGVAVYCNVPKTASTRKGEDEQGQAIEFIYDRDSDQYTCSMGQPLVRKSYEPNKGGRGATRYEGTCCQACPIRQRCTKARQRTIYRYDDEAWKEEYIKKMNSPTGRRQAALRRAYAEHPFGTVKVTMMDRLQLKLRGKYKVQTEVCLYHFAYNFKHLVNIESFEYLMGLIDKYDFSIKETGKKDTQSQAVPCPQPGQAIIGQLASFSAQTLAAPA